jgi:hypothetical protein
MSGWKQPSSAPANRGFSNWSEPLADLSEQLNDKTFKGKRGKALSPSRHSGALATPTALGAANYVAIVSGSLSPLRRIELHCSGSHPSCESILDGKPRRLQTTQSVSHASGTPHPAFGRHLFCTDTLVVFTRARASRVACDW